MNEQGKMSVHEILIVVLIIGVVLFLISTGFGSILIVFGLLYLFKVLLY